MSVASSFILATGAARTPDVGELVRESAAMESLFRLPTAHGGSAAASTVVRTPFPYVDELVEAAAATGEAPLWLSFPLPVQPGVLAAAARDPRLRGRVRALTFADPILLLCGDAVAMASALGAWRELGVEVAVERALPLAAVTVSPFLPRLEGKGYVADAVPADGLCAAFRAALRSPVVDVVAEGPQALWNAVSPASLTS
jgi:hypothetical protein